MKNKISHFPHSYAPTHRDITLKLINGTQTSGFKRDCLYLKKIINVNLIGSEYNEKTSRRELTVNRNEN